MFYEIKLGQKIKLSEVIAYSYYPDSTSDLTRRTLWVTLRGAKESFTYYFESAFECRKAYEALDSALLVSKLPQEILD